MKLYFARHGESEANVLRVVSNRGFQHPLTARGRDQAQALAEALERVTLTHLYSSPLQRAVETAEILAAAQGLSFEINDALREYDCGVLEGRSDDTAWAQHRQIWQDWLLHQRYDSRAEGGESFEDIRARFVPFIEGLIAAHGGTSAQIGLIAHGGVYRTMLPLVLDNIDFAFIRDRQIPNAAYIEAETEADRLVCRSWCGESVD